MPGADAPTAARLGALGAAGSIAYWRSERELSVRRYREQLALADQLGDPAATADAWFNLASATFVAGDTRRSRREAWTRHDRRYVELGDEQGANRAAWGKNNLILEAEGPAAMLEGLQPIYERTVALGDAAYVVHRRRQPGLGELHGR